MLKIELVLSKLSNRSLLLNHSISLFLDNNLIGRVVTDLKWEIILINLYRLSFFQKKMSKHV